jgi:hypothetical protein
MKHLKRSIRANELILVLLLASWLFAPIRQPVTAQEPGSEPIFDTAVYTAADGGSTIVSQRAALTSAYFEAAGASDGVMVTPDGLTLAAGAAAGVYRSDAIRSPLGHTSDAALTWQADVPPGASVSVEVRLSDDGQDWGAWLPVPVEYYPVGDGEYSGALVWVDSTSVHLQFRLTLQAGEGGAAPLFRRLTLFFDDTSQGPGGATAAAQAQGEPPVFAAGVCPKPPVISRTAWGCPDGQDSPRWPPAYQSVTHIVINHTATPNSASDWAEVVRSIWNYHANTRGWGDVGYHYLVDPLGNLYEGRAGGDDVIGAFDGFNRGAMGIGYIGCYGNCGYLGLSNADPSPTMLEAGNDLMAWKASQKGIDPLGSGVYCEATLPRIVPRSDVTCRGGSLSPGDRLRARIPSMRNAVQAKIAKCNGYSTIYGTVLLQGRTVHNGTVISLTLASCASTDDTGVQTMTDKEGKFSIVPTTSYRCLKAYHACYLTAQKDPPRGYTGRITLPGGDLNGDDCVNIYDLSPMGMQYGMRYVDDGSPPPCADINADGVVDIYDLVIAAGNYGKCGPVSNWE